MVSTGFTTVSGDLGVSPSNVVAGFPPGIVAGDTHAGDAAAALAQSDLVSPTPTPTHASRTPSSPVT